jgi:hypothetical protein
MVVQALTEPGPIERVFGPCGLDEFFARYYEREPLHVTRDDPSHFSGVYSLQELEASLSTGSRDFEKFALVKSGEPEVPADSFTTLRSAVRAKATGKAPVLHIDPRKVVSFFERGFTLIIKDAGLFSERLQRFCTALQRDLECYVQSNVYFTPAGAQGFEVHHDTHDTLTIQIEGEKRWRIYEPVVVLPQETQPFPSGAKVAGLRLRQEVTLRAGDTLYLPRGYPHEAFTSQGRSLHVTFALAPVRTVDVLDVLLRIASDASVELRRACPRGWATDADFTATAVQTALETFAAACTPERVALAREIVLNDLFAMARHSAFGAFDEIGKTEGIAPDAVVRVRSDIPFMIRERENTVDVLSPGRSLGFPPFCRGALEQLSRGPVHFSDFDPQLALENRHVLVRTLVREGIVEIETPTA